jgi:hypothetical protein
MATFLTTAKMDPALVARIEASVSGRRKKQPGRAAAAAPRLVSVARVGVLLFVVAVVYMVVGVRRKEKQDVSLARTELLLAASKNSASLTPYEMTSVARAEAWLVNFSRGYDGEVVADELRAPGALGATFARPTVYVRGAIGAFSSSRRIAEAATTSAKDALLLCLLEPPSARAEKDLLAKVRIAYAGGPVMEEHTKNVRRLHDAEVGLPFLTPQWAERVQNAPELADLTRLKRDLDRAPIESAKQAARAGLLLVAMDEPGTGGGPTELDGERTHWVRLGLVDMASEKILLSTRKLVDPSWISLAKKSEYASGLDGCGLAFDVHEIVRAPKK